MNVWAEDPWADNAAINGLEEDGTDNIATFKPNAAGNGFADDAGWGDFETSTANVWEDDTWCPEGGSTDTAGAEELVDPLVQSDATDASEAPDEDTLPHGEDHVQGHGSESTSAYIDARVTAQDHEAGVVASENTLADVGSVDGQERRGDVHAKFDVEFEETVKTPATEHRPDSSSSETTLSGRTASVSSERTSLEQGVPDEQDQDDTSLDTSSGLVGTIEAESLDGRRTKIAETAADPDNGPTGKLSQRSSPNFAVDLALLSKLFNPSTERRSSAGKNVSEELVQTTSERKAWHRLTRPQTLRGFKSGETDDTYVRIAWSTSRVRSETLKIVARWNAEDRVRGRVGIGLFSRSGFGWDEPQSRNEVNINGTRRLSLSATSASSPQWAHSRQASALAHSSGSTASPIASFGWSTSPTSPIRPSTFNNQPLATNSWRSAAENLVQRASSRPISSPDLGAKIDVIFSEDVASCATNNAQSQTSIVPSSASELQKTLVIDTSRKMTGAVAHDDDDDDDADWGEMVQSPLPSTSPVIVQTPRDASSTSISAKTQRPMPISPISSKQTLPEGPLSPARRAAFNAARVTRTISSSHYTTQIPDHRRVHEFLAKLPDLSYMFK